MFRIQSKAREIAMIRLTPQQHDELSKSPAEIARAVDPSSKVEYVLMRAEAYDRLIGMVESDVAATINDVMSEDDAGDPYLEGYQRPSRDCA